MSDISELNEILKKSAEKPIGSISSSGQYKKVGQNDWRRIGGHGDSKAPEIDKTPAPKAPQTVTVKLRHGGKEYNKEFNVQAHTPGAAWAQVDDALKKLEKQIGKIQILEHHIKSGKVEKAYAESEVSGTNIDTTHYAIEDLAARKSAWLATLREAFADMDFGDVPRTIRLDFPWELQALQVDDGIYDGHIKNIDELSGDFGQIVFQLKKMTLPAMVEALKAKEYILERDSTPPPPPVVEASPEEKIDAHGIAELIQVLKEFAPNTVNINFYRSFDSDPHKHPAPDFADLNGTLKALV